MVILRVNAPPILDVPAVFILLFTPCVVQFVSEFKCSVFGTSHWLGYFAAMLVSRAIT